MRVGTGEWKVTKVVQYRRDKMTQKIKRDKEAECLVGMCWRWGSLCYSDKEKGRIAQTYWTEQWEELWQHY